MARLARVQVTTPLPASAQALSALAKVTLTGRVSVMRTVWASDGPLLYTVTV